MNIWYLIILSAFSFVASTSMHTHKRSGQKEREEDGAFVHRDANHYDSDGKHNEHFDHEAILGMIKMQLLHLYMFIIFRVYLKVMPMSYAIGSKTTADEFDTLPPHIAKEKLKDLATKMDNDKDGFISKKELQKWVLKSFRYSLFEIYRISFSTILCC